MTTPLAQLIQERMDALDIRSGHELARRTETSPHGAVHQATIAKHRRPGRRQKPDERTLRSLAHALHVPVGELREACGLPAGELGPFTLPPEADYLSERERDAVLAVIRAFLERPLRPPLRLTGTTVQDVVVDEPPAVIESDLEQQRPKRPPSRGGRNAT